MLKIQKARDVWGLGQSFGNAVTHVPLFEFPAKGRSPKEQEQNGKQGAYLIISRAGRPVPPARAGLVPAALVRTLTI